MTTYILPITKNYVSNWTIFDAVRELIQNGLDGEGSFSIDYALEEEKLTLQSKNTKLEPKKLLLGCSEKADGSIGKFGEGLKLALVVLLREEKDIFIFNSEDQWRPAFLWHELYKEEILHIEELSNMSESQDLTISIYGFSPEDFLKVKELTLVLQSEEEIGKKFSTSFGDILLERKGKLYVGGLFVCETEMEYSYNVKPEFLTLERDRQTVGSWKLKSLTKMLWKETKEWSLIAENLEMAYQDFDYFEYENIKDLQEACRQKFLSSSGYYGGGRSSAKPYPVEDTEELQKAQKAKGIIPIIVKSKVFLSILKGLEDFSLEFKQVLKQGNYPVKRLQAFLRKYRDNMSPEAVVSLRHIIAVCKEEKWLPEKTVK